MLKEVVSILQVGFVGFAFLMAYLAFRLLRVVSHQETPEQQVLRAIRRYTNYTLAMAVLVVASGLAQPFADAYLRRVDRASTMTSQAARSCRDSLLSLNNTSGVVSTVDKLRTEITVATSSCLSILGEIGDTPMEKLEP